MNKWDKEKKERKKGRRGLTLFILASWVTHSPTGCQIVASTETFHQMTFIIQVNLR
jgi:hypothetical protein